MSDTMISTTRNTPPPTAILATISGWRYWAGEADEFMRADGEIGSDRGSAPGDEGEHLAGESAHQSQ